MSIRQSNETLMCAEPRDDGIYYYASFDDKPFANGACRYAYKGTLKCNPDKCNIGRYNDSLVVVKVFKTQYAKDYGAWNADISASKTANEYATLFNSEKFIDRRLYFPIPYVAKMDKRAGFWFLGFIGMEYDMITNPVFSYEYVSMEEYIDGNYIKFNSNNGYVSNAVNSSTIPAFSHRTFHKSNGALLVCDIQGVVKDGNYRLTDPAIHSHVANTYGLTDLGVVGQAKFYSTHQCNHICLSWKKLKLTTEVIQEISKIELSDHTTFSFQLPSNIKTNKNQFRHLSTIRE
ncbi:hypothetical protein I4U23_000209 [Adineta vaga]|nr:hypothetical protein I4U23_000209 [Adineta vaga]